MVQMYDDWLRADVTARQPDNATMLLRILVGVFIGGVERTFLELAVCSVLQVTGYWVQSR